jgi:hypothetical protein
LIKYEKIKKTVKILIYSITQVTSDPKQECEIHIEIKSIEPSKYTYETNIDGVEVKNFDNDSSIPSAVQSNLDDEKRSDANRQTGENDNIEMSQSTFEIICQVQVDRISAIYEEVRRMINV